MFETAKESGEFAASRGKAESDPPSIEASGLLGDGAESPPSPVDDGLAGPASGPGPPLAVALVTVQPARVSPMPAAASARSASIELFLLVRMRIQFLGCLGAFVRVPFKPLCPGASRNTVVAVASGGRVAPREANSNHAALLALPTTGSSAPGTAIFVSSRPAPS